MGWLSAGSQVTSLESQSYFSITVHLCWLLLQVGLSLYQNACSIFFCFVLYSHTTTWEFLNVDAIDIWGQMPHLMPDACGPLFLGDCPLYCRMFSSTPGFYLLWCQYNASSTHPWVVIMNSVFRHYQMFAWCGVGAWGKNALVKNHWSLRKTDHFIKWLS